MAGRRIDDHGFWAGGKSKGSVFPEGVHTKNESSAEGAGHLNRYQDTTEEIRHSQVEAENKAKKHPLKDNYRH